MANIYKTINWGLLGDTKMGRTYGNFIPLYEVSLYIAPNYPHDEWGGLYKWIDKDQNKLVLGEYPPTMAKQLYDNYLSYLASNSPKVKSRKVKILKKFTTQNPQFTKVEERIHRTLGGKSEDKFVLPPVSYTYGKRRRGTKDIILAWSAVPWKWYYRDRCRFYLVFVPTLSAVNVIAPTPTEMLREKGKQPLSHPKIYHEDWQIEDFWRWKP